MNRRGFLRRSLGGLALIAAPALRLVRPAKAEATVIRKVQWSACWTQSRWADDGTAIFLVTHQVVVTWDGPPSWSIVDAACKEIGCSRRELIDLAESKSSGSNDIRFVMHGLPTGDGLHWVDFRDVRDGRVPTLGA